MLSSTTDPIATTLDIWDLSKSVYDMAELALRVPDGITDSDLTDDDIELFRRIIAQEIPVSEHVTFNFAIEDAPISWREQAVRHRVGFKKSDNFAVDMFPEDGATFWSQSMRLLDMSGFATDKRYFTPESIKEQSHLQDVYDEAMMSIGDAYRYLVEEGVPLEDARNLVPVAATSRIMMTINLRALQHIIGKRGCWILQSSLWHPIIHGIIDELAYKIHPVFREMVHPPCISHGEFVGCTFKLENERRVDGSDELPVCPLYWTRYGPGKQEDPPFHIEMEKRIPAYASLWNQWKLPQTWDWEDRS